jgi:NitT/TauT family transport system substrate-binding protein
MTHTWPRRQALLGLAAVAGVATLPRAYAAGTLVKNSVAGEAVYYLTNYIAQDGGFFEKQGLDMSLVNVQSGPQQMAAVMGGSALVSTIGLEQNMHADARGGNFVAICACFNAFPMSLTVTRKAIAQNKIDLKAPLAAIVKRLAGLRIGITGPGSSTDQFIRTLLVLQNLNPDTEVHLLPVGPGANMLAAMEAGSVDGFVWSAPFSTEAVSKGLAEIVVDPMRGSVPEFTDYAYLAISTSRQTLASQRPLLLSVVRAYTATMKFAHEQPDKAREMIRHRFPNMNDADYAAAYAEYAIGIPQSPLISKAQFDRTLTTLNLIAKPPLSVTYDQIVVADLAREAMSS